MFIVNFVTIIKMSQSIGKYKYRMYIISFDKPIYSNEYADLSVNDKDNVHQNSVKKKILKHIRLLQSKHKLNTKDNQTIYENLLNHGHISDLSKNIISIIYDMNLYSKYHNEHEFNLLRLVWLDIENNKSKIKLFDENLQDCYDKSKDIVCLDGRISRVYQTLGINFVSLWEYKEEITNTLLYFVNKLMEKNKCYKYLCQKLELNVEEKKKLWQINYLLVLQLNKIYTEKYLKPDIIDYKVLKKILIENYKELFQL